LGLVQDFQVRARDRGRRRPPPTDGSISGPVPALNRLRNLVRFSVPCALTRCDWTQPGPSPGPGPAPGRLIRRLPPRAPLGSRAHGCGPDRGRRRLGGNKGRSAFKLRGPSGTPAIRLGVRAAPRDPGRGSGARDLNRLCSAAAIDPGPRCSGSKLEPIRRQSCRLDQSESSTICADSAGRTGLPLPSEKDVAGERPGFSTTRRGQKENSTVEEGCQSATIHVQLVTLSVYQSLAGQICRPGGRLLNIWDVRRASICSSTKLIVQRQVRSAPSISG
jgi:hypothetical protein